MTSTTFDLRHRWNSLFEEFGSVRGVALARVLFGPIVVFHLWGFLSDALRGVTYQDRFHVAFWDWLPHPPVGVYTVLLAIGSVAGLAMAIGVWSRVATATAFMVVGYNLALDQTAFQHNRAFLLMNLGLLALQPTGRTLSLDAVRHRHLHGKPPSDAGALWPLWLHRVLLSSVYLASGVSKLIDPDWIGGLVLWDRVVRFGNQIEGLPFDGVILEVLTNRSVYYVFAPVVLATEIFIGVGLWHSRTRLIAVWVAVVFHVSIEITANVHTFSYAALAALCVWTVPTSRDRLVVVAADSTASLIRALDWLGRFEIQVDREADATTVTDRDGTCHEGRAAWYRILLRLPSTFFIVAPLAARARDGSRLPVGSRARCA